MELRQLASSEIHIFFVAGSERRRFGIDTGRLKRAGLFPGLIALSDLLVPVNKSGAAMKAVSLYRYLP
jgi:hypothetical protein